MIDRNGGCVIIQCDTCTEYFEGDPEEAFASVWDAATDAGWHVRKFGGEWLHSCPDCEPF